MYKPIRVARHGQSKNGIKSGGFVLWWKFALRFLWPCRHVRAYVYTMFYVLPFRLLEHIRYGIDSKSTANTHTHTCLPVSEWLANKRKGYWKIEGAIMSQIFSSVSISGWPGVLIGPGVDWS